MGEERLSFLCIPRPFLHAAEVFYAWRPVHAPAAGIFLCLGACMGVEGSWYLISYNQDPTTPHGTPAAEVILCVRRPMKESMRPACGEQPQ